MTRPSILDRALAEVRRRVGPEASEATVETIVRELGETTGTLALRGLATISGERQLVAIVSHPLARLRFDERLEASERAELLRELDRWARTRERRAQKARAPAPRLAPPPPPVEPAIIAFATEHRVLERLEEPIAVLEPFLPRHSPWLFRRYTSRNVNVRAAALGMVRIAGIPKADLERAVRRYLEHHASEAATAARRAALWARPPATPALARLSEALRALELRPVPIGLRTLDPSATVRLEREGPALILEDSFARDFGATVRLDLASHERGAVALRGVGSGGRAQFLVETALDAVHDTEHALHSALREALAIPAWQRMLARISSEVSAPISEERCRLAIRVEDGGRGAPKVSAVIQRLDARGRWTKGARASATEIAELPRGPELIHALRAIESQDPAGALHAIAGTTYAIDAEGNPLEVRRVEARFALEDGEGGAHAALAIGPLRLAVADIPDRLSVGAACVAHLEARTAYVAPLPEAVRRVAAAAASVSGVVPREENAALLAALEPIAARVPIMLAPSLEAMLEPIAPVIYVRLVIEEEAAIAWLRVRLGGSLSAPAGEGGELVTVLAPGAAAPQLRRRDLGRERELAAALAAELGSSAAAHRPEGTDLGSGAAPSAAHRPDGSVEQLGSGASPWAAQRLEGPAGWSASPSAAQRSASPWAAQRLEGPAGWSASPSAAHRLEGPDALAELLEKLAARPEIEVEWPDPRARVRYVGPIARSALAISVRSAAQWFGVEGEVEIDGEKVQLAELLEQIRAGRRFVRLPRGRVASLSAELRERLERAADVVFAGAGGLRIAACAGEALEELAAPGALAADRAWQRIRARLRAGLEDADPPDALAARLRPYQVAGFRWLARLASLESGGVLADDMGLGKTVQALALLAHRAASGPAIVVAPTSLGDNWASEAERFAPSLRVRVHRGAGRAERLEKAPPAAGDVIVVSYDVLVNDADSLSAIAWASLVLDEAQAIKNPESQRAIAARRLSAGARFALTGTPLENRLSELWSIVSSVVPGRLGPWEHFRARFAVPIERYGDRERLAALAALVRPHLLRRTKGVVAPELPPRIEIRRDVEPGPGERKLYDAERARALVELASAGPEQRFALLASITRLRQLACDPALVVPEAGVGSAKIDALIELLEEIEAAGGSALVFSQFVGLLERVAARLDASGTRYLVLQGSTPAAARAERVAAFQAGEARVFLISLKAGGTGLNLTAADHVIHLDPWWNPAVEDQASDRAHRIGQTKAVTIVRLVAKGTIEETVLALHEQKRALSRGLLEGADAAGALAPEDLLALIRGSWEVSPRPAAPRARARRSVEGRSQG